MFRIHQVSVVVLGNRRHSVRCLLNKFQNSGSSRLLQGYISKQFFSSKDDEKKVCGKKTEQVQSHPTSSCEDPAKVKLKECKPIDINPCRPDPSFTSHRRVPSLKECSPPNMMSEMPTPDGNWKEHDQNNRRRGRNILLLGLLFTAAAMGTFYYMALRDQYPSGTKKKKKEAKKKKDVFKDPATSREIPQEIPYLLIGGGTASFSAFRAIKSSDPTAKVLVITEEGEFPYMRPPLSKELWFMEDVDKVQQLLFKQWNGSERSLYYEPEQFYTSCSQLKSSAHGGVAVARGWSISHLDAKERIAYLEDETPIKYGKCLLATGATPRVPPVFEVALQDEHIAEKIKLYRNISDFQDVHKSFGDARNIVIVGGGFLGSELACALGRKKADDSNKTITQIFRESGNMGKILPEYLSLWTTRMIESEGVSVLAKSEVIGVKDNGHGGVQLTLNDHSHLNADFVIVTVGVEPNTQLAEHSDLEVDPELGGFLVNTELQARTDLYVAGDCGCFYDPLLGRRRIEHHDHAVVSGRLAGENMTGARKPYTHQSMFWSDLGPEVGYEAIGIVDSRLPTVGVFAKSTEECPPHNAIEESGRGDRAKLEDDEIPAECEQYMTDEQKKEVKVAKHHELEKEEEKEEFNKGVIFYLRNDIVVGIVLWNVFNRMSIARQVLKNRKKYDDLNEVAKLFNIHDEEVHVVDPKDTKEPEEK